MPRLNPQRLLLFLLAACSVFLFIRSLVSVSNETAVDQISSASERISVRNNEDSKRRDPDGNVANVNDDKLRDGVRCEYSSGCAEPDLVIRLGAESHDRSPFGCLNDIRIFETKDLKKGLNIAVLDGETANLERMLSFDVESTDEKLISWLRDFREHQVILVVSLGDIAEKISPDARKLLTFFGAEKIKDWRHGDAYALLGQWGLEKSKAFELTFPLTSAGTTKAQFSDCYAFPLGELRNVTYEQNVGIVNRVDEQKLAEFNEPMRDDFVLGDTWPNCGRDLPCQEDEIPMHFFSGQNKDDAPKMCIAERYVFAHQLNEAGRGLNIAVIDPKSRAVVRVGHFDTYAEESSGLERFLDLVELGQMVAIVSFDEASTALTEMAKQILYELGSSMIARIKFRAAWYFVGQKGINAYTPFEDLVYPTGSKWATPIKAWICVPTSLSGKKGPPVIAETVRRQNIPKRHFCAKYDGHDEFCNDVHIDAPITPRPHSEKGRSDDPIFNIPIIIAAGVDFPLLRLTLDSVLAQPGINTQMVLVSHNQAYKEAADLASLFHAKPLSLNVSSDYNEVLQMSVAAAFALFPKADSIIVIEEEVVLSPDFLGALSQMLPVFRSDPSLTTIQAFNYNGNTRLSHDSSLIYRIDSHPPAYAFMLKRSVYEKTIRGNSDCCRRLHHWLLLPSESLVVDVSRVSIPKQPLVSAVGQNDAEAEPEDEERFSTSSSNILLDLENVATRDSYLRSISDSTANATVYSASDWSACAPMQYEAHLSKLLGGLTDRGYLVIQYADNQQYRQLLDCFGALRFPDFVPGKYGQYTRFFADENLVILKRTS